jgi:hypothetical protein
MADKTKARLDKGDEDFKKAKNPEIQVWESESGHIKVISDTKGATYIFQAHQSGSYSLITHDGKTINFSVGDMQNYGKGGISMTVDENMDVKVHGHNRLVVGGGSYVEVAGHAGIAVGGDVALVSKGNLNAHVDNIYIGAKGNMNFNVDGNMKMKVAGQTNFETNGNHFIKAANIKLNDPGDSGAA